MLVINNKTLCSVNVRRCVTLSKTLVLKCFFPTFAPNKYNWLYWISAKIHIYPQASYRHQELGPLGALFRYLQPSLPSLVLKLPELESCIWSHSLECVERDLRISYSPSCTWCLVTRASSALYVYFSTHISLRVRSVCIMKCLGSLSPSSHTVPRSLAELCVDDASCQIFFIWLLGTQTWRSRKDILSRRQDPPAVRLLW